MRRHMRLWTLAGVALPTLLFGQASAVRPDPAGNGKAVVIELTDQRRPAGPAGYQTGRDNAQELEGRAAKTITGGASANTPEVILVSVIVEPSIDVGVAHRPAHAKAAIMLAGTAPPAHQPAPATSAPPAGEGSKHPGDLKIDDIDHVVPSGYMGDAMSENGGTVNLESGFKGNCHQESTCYRMTYAAGQVGWAAIAWQVVTEGGMNWGDNPGADLHAPGFRSLRIWAAGESSGNGRLPKAQFKSGGNTKTKALYPASYAVSEQPVQLGTQLAEFCLDLAGRDLSNVVSPFTVVVTKGANPAGAVVIMSDIHYSTEACGH